MAAPPSSAPVPGTAEHIDPVRDWTESGIVSLTGRADGPPVLPPGIAATRARELSRHIAAASGVVVDGARILAERAAFTGHTRNGATSVGGSCRLLATVDGWAAVSCARPDDPVLLGALISEDITGDPWPQVRQWLNGHSGTELAERAELLGIAAAPVRVPSEPPPLPRLGMPRSVKDLLVVDFSALWAGPLCAHLLGLAGARVVKVETPTRPDGARSGNAEFYALLHGGHSSVVLDPQTAGGRHALAGLVRAADIVIEASRPRALAGFGLDAEAEVARGCTWISITANGRDSDRIGFGDDIAASSGLVARDTDDAPLFVGDAIADPLTGLTAAALAMSAGSDDGNLWDLSMTNVVASTLHGGAAALPRRQDGYWVLDCDTGVARVEAPRPREPHGAVSESGADTAAVLGRLGIALP
ncbi:MAG: CoA transferase [Rhodococcus sp. (in: high G+C Gram-positive bacteria)]|uniref:CoA transferase n=1 Tax=Rhodococcus sp. TaxID=1831 RepID=UPI003BB1E3B2